MNKTEILSYLKENKNERGVENWKKLGAKNYGLKSYGLGLTQLRKLAKQVGRDRPLAQKLWTSDVYDLKTIALLIDDPKQMTREQAEQQVEELHGGLLSHVYSSCDAALAKTHFAADLAVDWIASKDGTRRCCGYGLVYELAKSKKKSAPDEDYFLAVLARIEREFDAAPYGVQGSMGGALISVGKRSLRLNKAALRLAKRFGPIQFAEDMKGCDPMDVVKHLTSDYLRKKLSV